MSKTQTSLVLFFVVLIALLFAWAGGQYGPQFNIGEFTAVPLLVIAVLIVFLIQWLAFIPAYIKKTEHFYDLVGGVSYLVFVGGMFLATYQFDMRSLLLTVLVSIWALRLSLFLFKRVGQDGSDSRFDSIKHDFMRFLLAWTVQGLWIIVTAGCAIAAISSAQKVSLTMIDGIAILLWILGFAIEIIADQQKRQFKRQETKPTPFICQGLWRYSRHPNYFGEILLWFGIALLALPALQGWQYMTLLSPFFVVLLLTKISGIPLLEAKADERWQGLDEYQNYKNNTPVLLPNFLK